MATWVVGDVQGCLEPLLRLVERLELRPTDRLWLAGDLVNRGPDSLGVLRWARAQDPERLVTVLGNHDLHLLAVAEGRRKLKPGDTLAPILQAADRDALLAWLRARPLAHHEDGWLLVHAGLLPGWDLRRALKLARKCEQTLRASGWRDLLAGRGDAALQTALDALTRLRFCSPRGEPDFGPKGPPGTAPGLLPWFELADRRWAGEVRVLHGHWAALGLRVGEEVVSLDTGCVWGQTLTAFRLEDAQVLQVPARPPGAARRDTLPS